MQQAADVEKPAAETKAAKPTMAGPKTDPKPAEKSESKPEAEKK
jgi:hypothetical protein